MRPDRALADGEVYELVRHFAHRALEVERGLRDPDTLSTLMAPTGLKRWQQRHPHPSFPSRPVLGDDVGPARLSRSGGGVVFAAVTVRTEPGRWAAMSMRLDVSPGRFAVLDLHRLPATGERRSRRSPEPARDVPLEDQARLLQGTRELAAAAHDAVTRRLSELPSGAGTARAGLRAQADRWASVVDEHDRDLAGIYQRLQTRLQVQRSRHR